MLIKCTTRRREGRKSRRKSSDSLKTPFTHIKKSRNWKYSHLFKFAGFELVSNPVTFATGFVFVFTHKRTNFGQNYPGCITNPNTLNLLKKSEYFVSEYLQIRNLLLWTSFSVNNSNTFYGFYDLRVFKPWILNNFFPIFPEIIII